jgi:hypothetical protein
MTSQDVLQTLSASQQSPTVWMKSPCLSEYLAQHKKLVSLGGPGSCVQAIKARYAGGDLLVFFTEDIPSRPGVSIATTIALNYPTDNSAVAAVTQAAGAPTLTDGAVAMWCFDFPCKDMNRVLADPNSGQTLLVHRGAGLTLNDARMHTEREVAAHKVLEAQGVTLEP